MGTDVGDVGGHQDLAGSFGMFFGFLVDFQGLLGFLGRCHIFVDVCFVLRFFWGGCFGLFWEFAGFGPGGLGKPTPTWKAFRTTLRV